MKTSRHFLPMVLIVAIPAGAWALDKPAHLQGIGGADIIHTSDGDFDPFGVPLDSNTAALEKMDFKAVEKQANKGDAKSQFYLAKMYEQGIHTKKNPKKAIEYYQMSANNGYAPAMNNLAIHLENGKFIKQDQKRAQALLNVAAKQNQPHAIVNLAGYWANELGKNPNDKEVQKQYQTAKATLEKLGKAGYAPAVYLLSRFYDADSLFDKQMAMGADTNNALTDKEKDERRAKMVEYLTKSAEMGYAPAQLELSDYYQMNYVMNVDKSVRPMGIIKSYEWASRACINGLERGCATADYWGGIKTVDFREDKAKCEQGDEQSCNHVKLNETIQNALLEVDKKLTHY